MIPLRWPDPRFPEGSGLYIETITIHPTTAPPIKKGVTLVTSDLLAIPRTPDIVPLNLPFRALIMNRAALEKSPELVEFAGELGAAALIAAEDDLMMERLWENENQTPDSQT